MKLNPIHTLLLMLLMLLLLVGQLSAATAAPAGGAMPAMPMSAETGRESDGVCGEDCGMADTVCVDNCMAELACCAQVQATIFLPVVFALGDHAAEQLFTERISAYHYQSLSSIYHPPQLLIAL